VFATGERFALLARQKPLRDRSKALILPVISILRSSVQYGHEFGGSVAPDIRHVIKRQVSPEDPIYQRLINKIGLQNSDDLVSKSAFIDSISETGAMPGRIATRRPGSANPDTEKLKSGNLLRNDLDNNLYEIYEMPPPIYFTASYEITIWTQYMQEMNNVIAVIGTESNFNAKKTFRIETEKGYYFIAYVEEAVGNASNFEDFSEEERLVRSTMTIKVPGYFLGQSYKTSPNKIRRYVSSPQITFDVAFEDDTDISRPGIPSGNVNDYVLDAIRTSDQPLPGQFIGVSSPLVSSENSTSTLGGTSTPRNSLSTSRIPTPFVNSRSDNNSTTVQVVKTSTNKQGETTYRKIT
jgi:hypothetical protein